MNPYRGDFDITILEKKYTLRPDFDALCEFEQKAGVTVFEALTGLHDGKAPIKTITAAVWSGIRGFSRQHGVLDQAPSFESVGQRIQSHGIPKLLPDLLRYLSQAIASDDQIKDQEDRLGKEKSEV